MKNLLLSISLVLLCGSSFSQSDPVDYLFEKYSERDGFTSVMFSGRLLNLMGGAEAKEGNPDNILLRLKSIRILTEDDSLSDGSVNFYTELIRRLDMSVYEELMEVKEGSEVTKFLIKQSGNKISELLMISGGKSGNALISIRGDFLLKELADISKTVGIEELGPLKDVDETKKRE